MVTPLTITPSWLRPFFKALEEGNSYEEAVATAGRVDGTVGKEFARMRIKNGSLTVPVEGGAGVLKRRNSNPTLSEHGKWRREHLGAWNAAYGRTPYFDHLMPQIEAVYARSEGESLENFNRALLDVALLWLDYESIISEKSRLEQVARETMVKVNEDLSIFDAIFRLGKESVFALAFEKDT